MSRANGVTLFDFGEWKSEAAPRRNSDGTTSFLTTVPRGRGLDLVAGSGVKETLVTRDARHGYVFEER